MAKGDVKSNIQAVAPNDMLEIRPPEGEEWSIHNIYHGSDVDLLLHNGTMGVIFDTEVGAGVYAKYTFHVTHAIFLRVTNTTTNMQVIGYDGMATK